MKIQYVFQVVEMIDPICMIAMGEYILCCRNGRWDLSRIDER